MLCAGAALTGYHGTLLDSEPSSLGKSPENEDNSLPAAFYCFYQAETTAIQSYATLDFR